MNVPFIAQLTHLRELTFGLKNPSPDMISEWKAQIRSIAPNLKVVIKGNPQINSGPF